MCVTEITPYLDPDESLTTWDNMIIANNKPNSFFFFRSAVNMPLSNTSSAIEGLLKGYDVRLRPNFGGTNIYTCILVFKFVCNLVPNKYL